MKLPFLVVLLLSTLPFSSNAQDNDASFVIGIESNFVLFSENANVQSNIGSINGISIQKPIGQFSFGLALLSKNYIDHYSYRNPTGYTAVRYDRTIGHVNSVANPVILNSYQRGRIDPEYFSIGTRLFYRLDCNCIYFFSGFDIDYLREKKSMDLISGSESYSRDSVEELNENVSIKEKLYNFSFGIGFNLPLTEQLRFTARPNFVFSQKIYPDVVYRENKSPHFLQITLGLEYGI